MLVDVQSLICTSFFGFIPRCFGGCQPFLFGDDWIAHIFWGLFCFQYNRYIVNFGEMNIVIISNKNYMLVDIVKYFASILMEYIFSLAIANVKKF